MIFLFYSDGALCVVDKDIKDGIEEDCIMEIMEDQLRRCAISSGCVWPFEPCGSKANILKTSGKFVFLQKILPLLIAEGKRIAILSQFRLYVFIEL